MGFLLVSVYYISNFVNCTSNLLRFGSIYV